METKSDAELLRRFARTNAEDAFAEIVRRHVNLVYSSALRKNNGDEHLAKDIAQTVFADLARKADSLSRRENLAGWLYTSAHFAAAKIIRTENRRRDREEKFMREPDSIGTGVSPAQSANELAEWKKLSAALDDAMHELKATDRDAILLRYFENRQFAEVGAKLGLNENAARMRVERALEKLRGIFTKRGIATTAGFASAISANAIQIAPANLAATLTATSLATAGTGALTFLKIMTATKIKLALSAIVIAGAATAFVVQQQNQNKLREENDSLRRQVAQLQTQSENFSSQLASVGDSKKLSDNQFNELLKLRGEVGVLRRQIGELEKLRDENQQLRTQVTVGQAQTNQVSPEDLFQIQRWHIQNALKQINLAMRIYAGDHHDQYATNFDQLAYVLGTTNFEGNIGLDTFEFMNVGLVNDNMPNMLIFRERSLRQTVDGKYWEREYGLADGSVQTQDEENGNFNFYEQQHSPKPNQ